jgi:hypothetical protein
MPSSTRSAFLDWRHRQPLNLIEPPWYGPVCPVVWEGRSREAPPYPDHHAFARRLHRARADLPSFGAVRRIVPPMHLILEVRHRRLPHLASRTARRPGLAPRLLQQHPAPFVLEAVGPLLRMRLGRLRAGAVQGLGQVPQVFRGMVGVEDHGIETAEVRPQPVLQPRPAVREPDPPLGRVHADLRRLPPRWLSQGLLSLQ